MGTCELIWVLNLNFFENDIFRQILNKNLKYEKIKFEDFFNIFPKYSRNIFQK
jgi:hypothetical protein